MSTAQISKTKNPNKLLSKTPALIFLAIFLLHGYDFFTSLSYYNNRYMRVNNNSWIILLITAAIAICFLVSAIGCFTRIIVLQKLGFGLLAVFMLCSIMYSSNALAVNKILSNNETPLFLSYCLILARLAYALILLIAIRIPAKSRMLGIIAAGVYIVSFVYYLLSKEGATPTVFTILNLLLWGSGAIMFGLSPNMQNHTSNNVEEDLQQIGIWICPECGTENKTSIVNCSVCGKQRTNESGL